MLKVRVSLLSLYLFCFDAKLIVAKFWQLPGAEHHIITHDCRRINFHVSMLAHMQIEHELAERPLQPCERALENHKASAGELRGGFEIHQPERLAEIEMLLGLVIVLFRCAVFVTLLVGARVYAIGHVVGGNIRQFRHRVVEHLLRRALLLFKLRHVLLDFADLGHKRLGAGLVLLRLGLAHFLGSGVSALLQRLKLYDNRAARLVEREQAHGRGLDGRGAAARGRAGPDGRAPIWDRT